MQVRVAVPAPIGPAGQTFEQRLVVGDLLLIFGGGGLIDAAVRPAVIGEWKTGVARGRQNGRGSWLSDRPVAVDETVDVADVGRLERRDRSRSATSSSSVRAGSGPCSGRSSTVIANCGASAGCSAVAHADAASAIADSSKTRTLVIACDATRRSRASLRWRRAAAWRGTRCRRACRA